MAEHHVSDGLPTERSYRIIFESAADAIFLMSEHIFVDCNTSTLKMFGVTREQIIGQPPYRFSPEIQPDGRNSKEKALEKIRAAFEGKPQTFEWTHSKYNGTTFETEVRLNRVEVEGKTFVLAIVRDESQRKNMEAEIRESEARVQMIINNLESGMVYQIVAPRDGSSRKFTFLSGSVKELYGCTPEEAMKDPELIYGRFHKDDRARVIREEMEAIRTLSKFRTEMRVISPSGNIRWSSVVSIPRLMNDGSTCWDGIEFDITDRKLAEEALRKSEERYRGIIETALEGVWFLDKDFKTTEVNDAVVRMLGYSKEELIGRPFIDLLFDEDREAQEKEFGRRSRGMIGFYERRVRCKDGKEKWLLLSAKPIMSQAGKFEGTFAMMTDMTERKQNEELLKKTNAELKEKIENMELLNRITMDREERILELKEEVERLKNKANA